MKIFNWMQKKINGRHGSNRWAAGSVCSSSSSNRFPAHEPCKEEFSDWPDGLLAIGTFGNSQLNEEISRHDGLENSYSAPQDASDMQEETSDITKEELGKLQKELIKLLSLKPADNADRSEDGEKANLPLDRFLNCPSSLEVDRINCPKFMDNDLDIANWGDLPRNSSVVLSKGKDVCVDNNNVIKQRSLKFLLGKMFACRGGFASTPSLRDSFPESRKEKLLRAILHKKIYPWSSASSLSRKYLQSKHMPKAHVEDKTPKKEKDGYKWDKTDSEFIVLEM